MRKRVILPGALRTIRDLRAKVDPQFRGGSFGPKCGISHGGLANIEAGRRGATEELIHRLAAELDVPVDAISYLTEVTNSAVA